jgi:predicted Zn-dependent protease
MYLSMSTLYSVIDIILCRQFEKLLKIQTIILISLTAMALLRIGLIIETVEAEPYEWGKATITFIGALDKEIIEDDELTYYIDDSVDEYLYWNVVSAFSSWSGILDKIQKDSLIFKRVHNEYKADVVVKYIDEESGSDFFAKTDTFKNSNGEIAHSEITLYKNASFRKAGYDYEKKSNNGNDIVKLDEKPKYGKLDSDYYYFTYYQILKHEIGHALGLDHIEDNDNYLMNNDSPLNVNVPISNCEAAAVIKKNFEQRGLDEVIC